jgi:hypothetical protein
MDSARELGRMLLVFGAVLIIVGAALFFAGRLPLRLGRLPGDISYQGKHTSFYFPLMTCIILSVVLSALFWFISHLRR